MYNTIITEWFHSSDLSTLDKEIQTKKGARNIFWDFSMNNNKTNGDRRKKKIKWDMEKIKNNCNVS